MIVWNIADLEVAGIYREFLRVPSMSLGLYKHAVGVEVPQDPHGEDEVYYVIEGAGKIAMDHVDHPVHPGSLVFVPAKVSHHFHSVTRDLSVLVFFAPAEGTA